MNIKKASSTLISRLRHPGLPILALGWLVLLSLPPLELFGSAVMARKQQKPRTAEEVVERALLAYGGRPAIYVIQRNGIYRANLKLFTPAGSQEGRSVTKFIRKPKLAEDLVTIELELPDLKYTITSDGKKVWSTQNGLPHTPTEQEIRGFRGSHEHHYEALLRYKENGARLEYSGSNKIGTLDLDQIRLTSPDGIDTIYEISRRTGRIIYVNYEEKSAANGQPVKYRLYFKDFRVIQNTIIPYEIQVFQDGKLIEERRIVEAAFNVQMEEKIFQTGDSGTGSAAKPEEAKEPK